MSNSCTIASSTSIASTSGGSASAWHVSTQQEARESLRFGGAVGNSYSATCQSVSATRTPRRLMLAVTRSASTNAEASSTMLSKIDTPLGS
jgi:hypothetical protein